jgi:hypothetical protein
MTVRQDRSQLTNMAKAAKEAIGTETLEAVADRGYFSGEQIRTWVEAGVTVTLSKPSVPGSNAGTFRGEALSTFFLIRPPGRDWRAPTPRVPTFPHNQDPKLTLRRCWCTGCIKRGKDHTI